MTRLGLLAIVLAVLVATPAPATANTVLGQTALNDARVDGAWVPAGTTLLSPTDINTGAAPAAFHLATGQTVNLGPNSSARLAAEPGGRISLMAESGAVEIGTETGEVFQLAMNAVAMLEEHDEPSTGDPVVMIKVCDPSDKLIEWDAADIENCPGSEPYKCYIPKTVKKEDGTFDYKCKGAPAFLWLTKGAAAGLTAGAAVLGYTINDDNPPPVLCGVPDASGNVPPGTNPPGEGGCP